jgi:hypothetical protein
MHGAGQVSAFALVDEDLAVGPEPVVGDADGAVAGGRPRTRGEVRHLDCTLDRLGRADDVGRLQGPDAGLEAVVGQWNAAVALNAQARSGPADPGAGWGEAASDGAE